MLEALGLDTATEAVYRAMLAEPRDGAADIARRLGTTEEAVRRAWERLAGLSLVRYADTDGDRDGHRDRDGDGDRDGDRPTGRPEPVSPALGLDHLVARAQTELEEHRRRVAAARITASRLASEYAELSARTTPVTVEHLPDVAQIRARLAALTDSVRGEVMVFAPGGAQTEANRQAARPLNERLLGRGVVMRTVYLDSVRNDPATVAHARDLTGLGGQVRTVATLPIRMTLVDREAAVIPVDSEDSSAGAVVLTGQGPLTALCSLFETVWETARPLGDTARRADDGDELDRQEAAALRLLAEGHTDEGIAKRMGLSHRTARRIATVLMERLGARSRFEAGVRAVQRGWLPSDL
ncbi:helix-turn-helix domain-containing protein [Streptomyces sp. NPDC101160]|uniref:helix-turn-helix domain-containing protein n=1 Tax=Streptomyces sp. NPDC101160 TaxID=3366118 RepID=UPI003809CCA0